MVALLAVVVACMVPIGAHDGRVCVNRCYASVNPGAADLAFIEECAAAAGMSTGAYVATMVGITATGYGMVLGREQGIKLGNTLEENLSNLLDAADYPAWSDLDSATQGLYGTQENYDAAKFNSLMGAFGLADAYSDYSQGYDGSGGSNWRGFDSTDTTELEQIGRIGKLWSERVGVKLDEIRGVVKNRSVIEDYYVTAGGEGVYNGAGADVWPQAGMPASISYTYGVNLAWMGYDWRGNFYYSYRIKSLSDVYITCWLMPYAPVPGYYQYAFHLFSKAPFQAYRREIDPIEQGSPVNSVYNSSGDYYYANISSGVNSSVPLYFSQPSNQWDNTLLEYPTQDYIPYLLGSAGAGSSGAVNVPDYPTTEVPGTTPVYFPEQGVAPDTSWPVYIEVQRPENPYNPTNPENPGYQSGTPEWEQRTEQNITPLLNVHLEKLFPFCLVYDMQLLWDKFSGAIYTESGELRTQAVEDYTHISIPLSLDAAYFGVVIDEDIEINLNPLKDLLNITKPFVFFLLLFALLSAIVNFWKRILTGA